jgi:hypothetical protein
MASVGQSRRINGTLGGSAMPPIANERMRCTSDANGQVHDSDVGREPIILSASVMVSWFQRSRDLDNIA